MRGPAAAIALIAAAALVQPASASGTISCAAPTGARIDLTIGSLPVLSIVGAVIANGDEIWSTDPAMAEGTPIAVGEAFGNDGWLVADFTDPNILDILAELRLARASEGNDFITAGTLRIAGVGAYAVICEGP